MIQQCYGQPTTAPGDVRLECLKNAPEGSPIAGPLQGALQVGRRTRSSLGIQEIVYIVMSHTPGLLHMGPGICLDMSVDRLEHMLSPGLQPQLAGQVLPYGAGKFQPFSAHEPLAICSYR